MMTMCGTRMMAKRLQLEICGRTAELLVGRNQDVFLRFVQTDAFRMRAIPVCVAPTVEEFVNGCYQAQASVVKRGATGTWASRKWTPESLMEKFGHLNVPVELGFWNEEEVSMSMSTLVRTRRAPAPLLHRSRPAGANGNGNGRVNPLGVVGRQWERSLTTFTGGVGEEVGSSEARLWSRASFARSKFASGYTALAPKKLEQIMKVETVIFSPPEEITQIWNDYHIGRGHISAVMGNELYKVFEQRANECPLFVLPLRKGSGFISVVVQAQMPYMLFTALEDYRARGTEASPYFTVTHFTELVPTKGLVLVRGDIVFTSKLSDDEAETLLKTAHSFYINDERYRKVRKFNKDSREFDFKEVLQELNIPLQG